MGAVPALRGEDPSAHSSKDGFAEFSPVLPQVPPGDGDQRPELSNCKIQPAGRIDAVLTTFPVVNTAFLGGTYEKTPNQKLGLPDAADMKIVRPVLWRGEAVPHFCGRGVKKAPEIR